jgi:hypothetical protein
MKSMIKIIELCLKTRNLTKLTVRRLADGRFSLSTCFYGPIYDVK